MVQEGRRLAGGLKSAASEGAPRNPASLPTSPKQSSYSRDGEGNLLTALFEGQCSEPRKEVTFNSVLNCSSIGQYHNQTSVQECAQGLIQTDQKGGTWNH